MPRVIRTINCAGLVFATLVACGSPPQPVAANRISGEVERCLSEEEHGSAPGCWTEFLERYRPFASREQIILAQEHLERSKQDKSHTTGASSNGNSTQAAPDDSGIGARLPSKEEAREAPSAPAPTGGDAAPSAASGPSTETRHQVEDAVTTLHPSDAAKILTNLELPYKVVDSGGRQKLIITYDGFKSVLTTSADGKTLQLDAGFEGQLDANKLNEWNKNTRFGRAYLATDGSAHMAADLDMGSGVSVDQIKAFFLLYKPLLASFTQALRN